MAKADRDLMAGHRLGLTQLDRAPTLRETAGVTVMRVVLLAALTFWLAVPAGVQAGAEEIIVTAARREAPDYDERVPNIGLRRLADFAVQEVYVTGDTYDAAKRHDV